MRAHTSNETDYPDQFWHRVKQLLKTQKITQKKFAELIEVPVDTLWGWMRYDRIPGAFTACKIAEVLGVTVEYLVRGKNKYRYKDTIKEEAKQNAIYKATGDRIKKLSLEIEKEAKKLRE